MSLRPLRNATITFGLVNIPVRFYTATKSEDVHFNLLHESCGTRVNQKWWCPHHEEIISPELRRSLEGGRAPARRPSARAATKRAPAAPRATASKKKKVS